MFFGFAIICSFLFCFLKFFGFIDNHGYPGVTYKYFSLFAAQPVRRRYRKQTYTQTYRQDKYIIRCSLLYLETICTLRLMRLINLHTTSLPFVHCTVHSVKCTFHPTLPNLSLDNLTFLSYI